MAKSEVAKICYTVGMNSFEELYSAKKMYSLAKGLIKKERGVFLFSATFFTISYVVAHLVWFFLRQNSSLLSTGVGAFMVIGGLLVTVLSVFAQLLLSTGIVIKSANQSTFQLKDLFYHYVPLIITFGFLGLIVTIILFGSGLLFIFPFFYLLPVILLAPIAKLNGVRGVMSCIFHAWSFVKGRTLVTLRKVGYILFIAILKIIFLLFLEVALELVMPYVPKVWLSGLISILGTIWIVPQTICYLQILWLQLRLLPIIKPITTYNKVFAYIALIVGLIVILFPIISFILVVTSGGDIVSGQSVIVEGGRLGL